MTVEYRVIPMVLTLLLAGCASAPAGLLEGSFRAQNEGPFGDVDPLFVHGLNILCVEQPQTGGIWATDDWVLLGVKVAHGESQDVWLVRLSSLRPEDPAAAPSEPREFAVPFGMGPVKTGTKFTAPAGKLLVELFDQNGMPQRSSIRTIPQVQFNATLLDVLATGTSARRDVTDQPRDIAKAITLIQMMGGARALLPIREAIKNHIVKQPSILAIMFSGFRLKLEANIDRRQSRVWSETDRNFLQREEAKFPLLLSGQRLFDCRVVAGPTTSPFNLTAGALVVEAVNPQDSTHRLTVSVLAAKQGAVAAQRFALR